MSKTLLKYQIKAFYERVKENYQIRYIQNKSKGHDAHTKDIMDIQRFYKGFEVRLRIAQGVVLPEPFMSFLKYGQDNKDGFYPVIHYFGENDTLEVYIGKSNNNEPSVSGKLLKDIDKFHQNPKKVWEMDNKKKQDKNLTEIVDFLDEIMDIYDKIYIKHGYSE